MNMKTSMYKLLLLGFSLWGSLAGLTSCQDELAFLYGKEPRPEWAALADHDFSTSMTAVIKVESLAGKALNDSLFSADDMLAAFIQEQCCGVATLDPTTGLFFLYIAMPNGMSGSNAQLPVSLRYYSARFTNIYEAKDVFMFANDTQQGLVADPYIPVFKLRGK